MYVYIYRKKLGVRWEDSAQIHKSDRFFWSTCIDWN